MSVIQGGLWPRPAGSLPNNEAVIPSTRPIFGLLACNRIVALTPVPCIAPEIRCPLSHHVDLTSERELLFAIRVPILPTSDRALSRGVFSTRSTTSRRRRRLRSRDRPSGRP